VEEGVVVDCARSAGRAGCNVSRCTVAFAAVAR